MKELITNNFINKKLNNPKRFSSLSDSKLFEEFPHTKPLVIAELDGSILYGNLSFTKSFNLSVNQNLAALETEPDLFSLVQGFAKSKYSSFHFDIFYPASQTHDDLFYYVEIERIFIGENEFFVLVLSSLAERFSIEKKMNNLHNALEYGNVPVIIANSEGHISYSTKSFEDILKLNIEELYNKKLTAVFASFLDEIEIESLNKSISTENVYSQVISDIDENGNIWYKELQIKPVTNEENGKSNFVVTANDITNYILKNRIIKRSEEKQRSIINNISDLLMIIRNEKTDLLLENANDNFFDTFRIDRNLSIGKNIKDFLIKDFFEVILNAIISISEMKTNTLSFKYSDETLKRDYIGSVTFTDDHYNMQRIFIISFKDATEQQLTEQKLRDAFERENKINQLKSSFLANMSHEIRTPLNAIVGYSELIQDDVENGDTESALELFSYLNDGFNRLLILVDNILEVSLIESGEAEIDLGETNLNDTAEQVYRKMEMVAKEKNMIFELKLSENIKSVNADSAKLIKVLIALVDNAIKYNDAHGKIGIFTSMNENSASISVSDTGIGIKEENLERMLQSFAQEDEGHKRQYEGAGLGLTIAYNLTKLMGGSFDIQSKINEGTTITITFGFS